MRNNSIAIDQNARLEIHRSRVQQNSAFSFGGGISNRANTGFTSDLLVGYSEIASNKAGNHTQFESNIQGFGGGIANTNYDRFSGGIGKMTITHSAIRGNGAINAGGAGNIIYSLFSLDDAALEAVIENSVISGNYAAYGGPTDPFSQPPVARGGGLSNLSGSMTVHNSTVADNSASQWFGYQGPAIGEGGGVFGFGTITVTQSTIVRNSASDEGGGLSIGSRGVQSSIVFSNTAGSTATGNCARQVNSLGHNLEDGASCGFTQTGDLSNTDPMLGPFVSNPAPGAEAAVFDLTYALLPDSPAIDAGDNATCPATDQRGVSRPQGNGCDIGAYEVEKPLQYIYLPLTQK